MPWVFPAPLALVATITVVLALALLLRGARHAPLRWLGEAVMIALGVIAALWVGWLVLWLISRVGNP